MAKKKETKPKPPPPDPVQAALNAVERATGEKLAESNDKSQAATSTEDTGKPPEQPQT